jgi:hypothetical protein
VTKAQFGFCSSAVDADAMTGLHYASCRARL